MKITLLSILTALSISLATPLVHAAPASAACCFTGAIGSCFDISMASICSFDPYCCNNWWDAICISHFEEYHEWSCPPQFDGVYSPAGSVEISEFGEVACESGEPECQWTVDFELPANPIAGSSMITFPFFEVACFEGPWGAGGDGGALVQVVSNRNGIVRGQLHTSWMGDLEGACAEPVESLLFQVTPQTAKSCFAASAHPMCNDPSTETCVCNNDPYCCQTAWDSLCVAQAWDCLEW